MSFFFRQKKELRTLYTKRLGEFLALSKLFSEKDNLFLDPKILEYIFCTTFSVFRTSKDNMSFDAVTNTEGIAIKTFIRKSAFQFEKVSQFKGKENRIDDSINRRPLLIARHIARLFNERLASSMYLNDVKGFFFHVILRNKSEFDIAEFPFTRIEAHKVAVDNAVPNAKKTKWSIINFSDGQHSFKFSSSDQQLWLNFRNPENLRFKCASKIRRPLDFISRAFVRKLNKENFPGYNEVPFFVLPLYSIDKNNSKYVELCSGINQWNSKPRKNQPRRNFFEVYIPFNKNVRTKTGGFFPKKGTPFQLVFPDGQVHAAKITSGDKFGKGIYTNPNRQLGLWLLRNIRGNLKNNIPISYDHLMNFNSDCIIFFKFPRKIYEIFFAPIGFFEEFQASNYDSKHFSKERLESFFELKQMF